MKDFEFILAGLFILFVLFKVIRWASTELIRVNPKLNTALYKRIEKENQISLTDLEKKLNIKEMVVKKNIDQSYRYKDELGYSKTYKGKKDIIEHPKILKTSKNNIQIQYPEGANVSTLMNQVFIDYIGKVFFDAKIINNNVIKANRTNHPLIVNYHVVEAKNLIFTKPIDEDGEYILKLSSLIDKGKTEVFFGEAFSPDQDINAQIVWSLAQSPHMLVAGQTRSGKTKTILSLTTMLASIYPDSIFFFGDGKGSPDYDLFSHHLSEYPVAKPTQGDTPLAQLEQVVGAVWAEYKVRQSLFSGSGFSTYLEYNKNNNDKLPRVFLVIDEFAGFNSLSEGVEAEIKKEGSLYYRLRRLLAEAASYGFTIILASQRVQATDFPTPIRDNLTSWLIHSVNLKSAEFLGLNGKVEALKAGQFVLKIPGLRALDGDTDILVRMPYVGDSPEKITTIKKEIIKKEFESEILPSGEIEFSKLKKNDLKRYIKKLFIENESFNIKEEYSAETDYISLKFEKDNNKYGLGVIDITEALEETFYSRLYRLSPELKELKKIWFFIGKINNSKKEQTLIELIENQGDIALIAQDYERLLKKAKIKYDEGEEYSIFAPLLGAIDQAKKDELKELKIKDDELGDVVISLSELERINNMTAKTDRQKEAKGEAFERLVHAVYRRLGWTTYTPEFLFTKKYYSRPGDVGDLGLDMLMLKTNNNLDELNEEDSDERVAVQIKNWGQTINAKIIGEVLRAQNNFKCLVTNQPISKGMIISTSNYTSYAKHEAKNNNIELVGYNDLVNMIKEITKDEGKINTSKPTTQKEQITMLLERGDLSLQKVADQVGCSKSLVAKVKKQMGENEKRN